MYEKLVVSECETCLLTIASSSMNSPSSASLMESCFCFLGLTDEGIESSIFLSSHIHEVE